MGIDTSLRDIEPVLSRVKQLQDQARSLHTFSARRQANRTWQLLESALLHLQKTERELADAIEKNANVLNGTRA